MELNEESILLEIGGIASGNFNKLKYRISKNNSIKFSQNIGEREYKYSITYAEDEEINGAKMPIHQFIRLFNSRVRLDNAEKSIYPPIFYSINQKYYNAAVKFLEKKIITHLKCGEFSISKIIYDYYPDLHFTSKKYIEALIVLYNIEYAGDRAYLVYHPNVIILMIT